jgi:hypothetical protein
MTVATHPGITKPTTIHPNWARMLTVVVVAGLLAIALLVFNLTNNANAPATSSVVSTGTSYGATVPGHIQDLESPGLVYDSDVPQHILQLERSLGQ